MLFAGGLIGMAARGGSGGGGGSPPLTIYDRAAAPILDRAGSTIETRV